MTLTNSKNYLNERITNSWYRNAEIDYGITGKFLDVEIIENNLKIIWEEMGERVEMIISWFTEYDMEQIYNISGWGELSTVMQPKRSPERQPRNGRPALMMADQEGMKLWKIDLRREK